MKTKLDSWVQEILCDPISKSQLRFEQNCLVSDYGRRYALIDGVYDLRALSCHVGAVSESWERSQADYEECSGKLAKMSAEDYALQRCGVEPVYREIRVLGRCLDVGGNDGRLRAFLDHQQEYISIDPYLGIIREPRSPECKRVYPFIDEPFNFLAAFAEHLPFSSQSLDVVHMRSVIDHFMNPELALREAFRVLRKDGSLVVGSYVKGGRTGREDMRARLKAIVRWILVAVGFKRFWDHHIWHPTYNELCQMITDCGFRVDKVHWQRSEQERVCYIWAIKCPIV